MQARWCYDQATVTAHVDAGGERFVAVSGCWRDGEIDVPTAAAGGSAPACRQWSICAFQFGERAITPVTWINIENDDIIAGGDSDIGRGVDAPPMSEFFLIERRTMGAVYYKMADGVLARLAAIAPPAAADQA